MPYYSSDSDDDYRGRRRPSAHRHRSDRKSNYLGADLGGGLHRTRSQGHSPAPVVNVFNDVAADAYQRTEASKSPPYGQRAPYPPSPDFSQRGRRDRLGSDLINEIEDLTLENRRLRSRSRGRSDAGFSDNSSKYYELELARQREKDRERDSSRSKYYEWELRQKEKELREIEKQKQWEADKRRYEQDWQLKKIDDDKERKRIIEDHERKQREEADERKAEEKRILEKHEREEREKKEKEKKEWEEFERRQKEKKAKEEEEKKKKEAEFEEEMRRRLSRQGYTEAQIDRLVKDEKNDKKQQTTTTTTTVEKWKSAAPVYAKIHRDYISIDTLRYYEIPFEYDRNDANFIIILREMDKYETEVLFEHTRRLRAGKLLLDAPGKDKKQYAFYRKRDRSSSRVKKVGILEFKT